jgi:hypothetical protein
VRQDKSAHEIVREPGQAMPVLEALKILEDAVLECKKRDIDTPEVREALDLLDPYCGRWQVEGFRSNLHPTAGGSGALEGQQQVLRIYFSGIYRSVRALLQIRITRLVIQYTRSQDEAVKAELNRLTAELAKFPERWEFYVGR